MKNTMLYMVIATLIVVASSCNNIGSSECIGSAQLIWHPDDIEGSKITEENPNARLRQVRASWREKPPFYNGTMPVEWTSSVFDVVPPSMSMGMGGIVVVDDYEGFENLYIYSGDMVEKVAGVPIGAVTISKESQEIIAEAKVINKDASGLQIEETHYKNCAGGSGCCLLFRSKSSINRLGYKEKESDTTGRKEKDYYFMWPMSSR